MNPASKSIIPDSFRQVKKIAVAPIKMPPKVLKRVYWTNEDLGILANLRAMNVPLEDCGKYLGKSLNSCGGAIFHYDLYEVIAKKKESLIKAVLNAKAS